jgi:hypothetical protein
LLLDTVLYLARKGPDPREFDWTKGWYTNPMTIRTRFTPVILINSSFICTKRVKPTKKIYRNPILYARELHDEMIRDNLTRKQLAQRHMVSSDRITQWLCLLKLPEEKLREIEALGDYWDKRLITERELRRKWRSHVPTRSK